MSDKPVELRSCSSCGSRVSEVHLSGGLVEMPPDNGYVRLERFPERDLLTLKPCGCIFIGREALAEATRVVVGRSGDTPVTL